MKQLLTAITTIIALSSCNQDKPTITETTASPATEQTGQSGVMDDVSNPNIVQVASGSKDHTTLVEAVKAASLVDALSNAGPFTVFAPTNDAFNKLPAGTVENLLKPENKETLKSILEYHTYVGVLKTDYFSDGQEYEEVSGQKIKISIVDGKPVINGKAHILASIPTSNGIIHVIDEVLTAPTSN